MAVAVGTFSGSTLNGGTHTESIGFDPDVVFFTSTHSNGATTGELSVGFIAGMYQYYWAFEADTGGNIWGSGKVAYNKSTEWLRAALGPGSQFALQDGGASSYIEQNSSTVAYMAVGGLDEVDGRLISTSTSVNVNLGWEPDLLMIFSGDPENVDTSGTQATFNIGITDGTSWWYLATKADAAADRVGDNSFIDGAVGNVFFRDIPTGNVQWDAAFSGTGYTISHGTGATRKVSALALKGIEWEAFFDTDIPQTTQTDVHGSGLTGTPEGTILVGALDDLSAGTFTFGFSDGTTNEVGYFDENDNNVVEAGAYYLSHPLNDVMSATVTYNGSNQTEVAWVETGTFDRTSSDMLGFTFRTVNTPPNAPTLVSPGDQAGVSAGNVLFDWTFSDPDAGDTQSAYSLRRKQVPDG